MRNPAFEMRINAIKPGIVGICNAIEDSEVLDPAAFDSAFTHRHAANQNNAS